MGFIGFLLMLVNIALIVYAILLASRFVEAVERIASRQAFSAERAMLERLTAAVETLARKSEQ